MNQKNPIKKLTLSSMFLALAFLMPFLTGHVQQINAMLCPMHIPIFLCGYFCGAPWGLLIGFLSPILRSMTFGMPLMFPTAISMAFELATYGFITGYLYTKQPDKKSNVYLSLIIAMILGRVARGLAMLCCVGLDVSKFGFEAFFSGIVLTSIPGIIIQIILIPFLVIKLKQYTILPKK